jgi:hypothetical protein
MVSLRAARDAADRYADDMVDEMGVDDPNDEHERALIEDVEFRSLAIAAEQLDLMDTYEDLDRHASTFANTAETNLQLALEERAATVLDESDETESPDEAFNPADYDDVREALLAAPNGYSTERILDHFDPMVDDEEVSTDA